MLGGLRDLLPAMIEHVVFSYVHALFWGNTCLLPSELLGVGDILTCYCLSDWGICIPN